MCCCHLCLQAGLSTFYSHTWVRGTFIVLGTVTGQVGVFLRNEQRGCYQQLERTPIVCVAPLQAGFVTLSHGMLTFYAATGAEDRYIGTAIQMTIV